MKELLNKIHHADCLEFMKQLPDKCVDLVLTDPPYGYLNLDFDKNYFDTDSTFYQINRIMKDNSFFVFTGFSDSFYEWNIKLKQLGLKFCENLVWDKKACSGAFGNIYRQHELISIRRKGNIKLNKIYIDYMNDLLEKESYLQLNNSLKRIISSINKKEVKDFLENKIITYNKDMISKFNITGKGKSADRGVLSLNTLLNGQKLPSIITISRDSVYDNIHPTQKPVKLFETLIKLCADKNKVVLDCFSGSGTTAIACHRLGIPFICIEKDKDYWEASIKRLEQEQKQLTMF